MTLQPRVVDISHHNPVHDLQATANAGIWGIIHKASQGTGYKDPTYDAHRQLALDAGLLWGAYHFNTGEPVEKQVDWFLRAAKPDNTTLLVLDYEDNTSGTNMTVQQAVQFLRLIEQKTGRKAAIYSGNRLKENIGKLNAADRAYVISHPLWLCQYSATPKLPPGYSNVFLWQYTDGHFGPAPHGIPGITGDVDLNTFRGTREDLEAIWVASGPLILESGASSHSAKAAEDQPGPAQPRSDDGGEVPTFMPAEDQPASNEALNVQPPSAAYSLDVEIVQRKLDRLGYHEVGLVDGLWGGKIKGALTAFLNDRGSGVVVNGGLTPAINDAISKALAEGWTRPIAESRAKATAKDIAPKVEAVRMSLWQRLGAKITAGAAGLGLTGSTLSSTFDTVRDKLEGIHNAFAKIPPEVWFIAIGGVALLVWWASSRAANATVKDYNSGKLN